MLPILQIFVGYLLFCLFVVLLWGPCVCVCVFGVFCVCVCVGGGGGGLFPHNASNLTLFMCTVMWMPAFVHY